MLISILLCERSDENKRSHYHDEAGVVSVPPTERWHADLGDSRPMEHLAGTVRVATQDETWLQPPK